MAQIIVFWANRRSIKAMDTYRFSGIKVRVTPEDIPLIESLRQSRQLIIDQAVGELALLEQIEQTQPSLL